jgi:hypothetical protein
MKNLKKTKEFHFVVNNSLKSKIKTISTHLKLSMSKTILFIIERNYALMNIIHLQGKNENSRQVKVDWNEHFHFYIPINKNHIYHHLKSIHKNNNSYSIAVNLRNILQVFVTGVEKFGLSKYLSRLENAGRIWMERIRKKNIWYKTKKVRQLTKKTLYSVLYSTDHTPIFIKLLN